MREYFLRRFLLIPPTLIGVTIIVFLITRVVPGGPLEQAMMEMQHVGEHGGGGTAGSTQALSESNLETLKEYYGFDKPTWEAYLVWLGVIPTQTQRKTEKFEKIDPETGIETKTVTVRTPEFAVMDLDWDQDGWLTRSEVPRSLSRAVKFDDLDTDKDGFVTADECIGEKGIISRPRERIEIEYHQSMDEVWILNEDELMFPWQVRMKPRVDGDSEIPRAEIYLSSFKGVLQGELGDSFRYNEPVTDVIIERLPVSTYFGIMTVLLTYIICVPLGVLKAIQHNSFLDNFSSFLIFMGYAIPGYVLGSLLWVFVSVNFPFFPIRGFHSDGFEGLSFLGKCWDVLLHSFLPLTCYMVGSFAFVTMMMKNHLMDNLSSDYIRTALAKGVEFKDAVHKHAFRNSLIPIATNFGHQITLFVTGNFLIEQIFDIEGFGLLGFNSVVQRDYPVVMGVLLFSATLMLLGNILADILVAIVDPRIRFN